MSITPLAYIRRELSMTPSEWTSLPKEDKDQLKVWAEEELAAIAREEAAK